MAQERIDSIIDIPAVKKEFDEVIGMLDKLGVAIKSSSSPTGSGSMAQSLTERKAAMAGLQAQTEQMIATEKKLEQQVDAVVEAAKEATKVNKESVESIKSYNGTLDSNIKLQIQYKTQISEIRQQQKELQKNFTGTAEATKKYEEQMVQLVRKEKELQAASTELNSIMRNQVKEMNAAGNSLNELRSQLSQMKAAADNMDIGSQEFIDAQKAIGDLNDKIKGLEFSRGDFQRNVGNYAGTFSGAFNVLKTSLEEVRAKMEQLKATGEDDSPQFENLVKEEQMLYKLTTGLNTEFKSTRAELRTMQQAATELALAWGQNNDTVREFISQVGEAKDSIGDVSDAIKLAASDTNKLDNLINAAQGIAGVFGVAEGAVALFGDENKELQKTLIKLQAIMTIMNGLQAIQNELKRKDSIFTTAQIAAQKAYAMVVGTSTGALKAFRVALAATGIGLIVLALVALITNFTKVKEAVYKLIPGLQLVGKFIGGIVDWVTDLIGVTSDATRQLKKLADEAEKNAKRQSEWLDINGDKYDEYTRRKVQANIDYNNKVKEINDDETKNEKQKLDTIRQYREKANREILKAEEDRQKAAADQRKAEADKRKQEADKRAQEQKKIDDQIKKDREAAANAIAKANDDIAKRRMDDMNKELYDLRKQYDEEKKIVEKGKGDVAVITKNYLEAIDDIKKKYAEKDKKKAEEDAKELADKEKKEKLDAIEKTNAELMVANSVSYAFKMRQLNTQLAEEKITLEEYNKEKEALEEQYRENEIRLEIQHLKRLLSTYKDGSKEKLDLLKQINDLEMSLDQKKTDKQIENSKKVLEMEKKTAEAKKALVGELKNLTVSLIEGTFDKQKNEVQIQIDNIEKQKAAEIDRISSSTLSEQEKADKIKIIEAKAQADRESLERRKRQIDMQKAKFDRDRSIFEIGVNTAVAISKAVAEFPLTGGMPFAAIAAAIGAVQIAAVLAKPLPRFEKGTTSAPEGYAITDEKGPEMYIEPGGKTYMGSDKGPTLRYLKKGTQVIPHDQVNQLMLQSVVSNGIGANSNNDNTAKEIRGLKEVMYWQTGKLSEVYKKQRPNNVKVVITSDWNTYIQQAVRD